MKIKRLYITDDQDPSQRKQLCWEDEYGNWELGDCHSPAGFAQGVIGSPGTADRQTQGPHPELVEITVYSDWLDKGEDGPSFEMLSIIDPVIIEAYRRWNAKWWDDEGPGDLPLPTPGTWTINRDGSEIHRTGDLT